MTVTKTILDEICAKKAAHVEQQKGIVPPEDLRARLADAPAPRGFSKALQDAVANGQYGLICEIKKASPSKGLIRADFDPAGLARAYETGGATCLSVLTDQPYFQGADPFLMEARSVVGIPVLRKDFMIDPYQIDESRVLGADCILLILSALSESQAMDLEGQAHDLGMDVLIEVHDAEELERAALLKSPLVGVNNRNLKTMSQSLETSINLAADFPPGRVQISESALGAPEDLAQLEGHGYHCFLIGETFMREKDVTAAVKRFQKSPISEKTGSLT